MKLIDKNLLDQVCKNALESPRRRMNYNFHSNESDPVNRLLNAMYPGSYFPPHRHMNPDKDESFLVLRGRLMAFLFDDNGNVTHKIEIDPLKGVYGMDFPAHVWHTFIVLEPETVVYEVKEGPYVPLSLENIAPWAPDSSNQAEIDKFLYKLMND